MGNGSFNGKLFIKAGLKGKRYALNQMARSNEFHQPLGGAQDKQLKWNLLHANLKHVPV